MASPTKKTLTEVTHASQSAASQAPNTYIHEDLAAALRNRASRVRKSVMEGYSINRNIDASTTDTSNVVSIFRSARDINQDVFKPGTVSPFCSPKKRGRVAYEDVGDESDADVEMGESAAERSYAGVPVARPIKPLPRLKLHSNVPYMVRDQSTPHVTGDDPFV